MYEHRGEPLPVWFRFALAWCCPACGTTNYAEAVPIEPSAEDRRRDPHAGGELGPPTWAKCECGAEVRPSNYEG